MCNETTFATITANKINYILNTVFEGHFTLKQLITISSETDSTDKAVNIIKCLHDVQASRHDCTVALTEIAICCTQYTQSPMTLIYEERTMCGDVENYVLITKNIESVTVETLGGYKQDSKRASTYEDVQQILEHRNALYKLLLPVLGSSAYDKLFTTK